LDAVELRGAARGIVVAPGLHDIILNQRIACPLDLIFG
jgi:hypothetical protein